ncbi:hypothetical protein SK128_009084 [Halocaridina rubra]|uniref:Uncharacterized protein n=1 Tax=Halocaridina rubra TaxID=373956 RepID=A0AAN8XN32_HALRR
MVPVPASNIKEPSEGPVIIEVSESWWNTVQGVDKSEGNGLKAAILSLQESYLSSTNVNIEGS